MSLAEKISLLETATVLLIAAFIYSVCVFCSNFIYNSKINKYKGKAEGKVEEVIDGWKLKFGGKFSDRYPVFSYTVNEYLYILKPYLLRKDVEICKKYKDGENCTCTFYFGPSIGTNRTRYKKDDKIEILYDISDPKKYVIVDNKDRWFFANAFSIISIICMFVAIILIILTLMD